MSTQPIAPEAETAEGRLFAELEAKVREFRPKDDLAPLEKAYRFSSEHHSRQKRDSGEPFMNHPLMVSHTLADMKMDLVCIETGLLHDVVEDTGVSIEEIERRGVQNIPLQRANEPEDIAAMIVFLASPGARNITGQSFNVDGGLVPH